MTNRALPYISWCSTHSKDGKRYMIRISAHYLLSKHNNTPKTLRCLVLFTDNCEAILQSDVLKDVGHLRRWHCQHCHMWSIRAPMGSVLHSVQDCLTVSTAGTQRQQSLRRKRSDTWHQERTGEIILTLLRHSLVHNLPTDTSGTLAHNTLKPESKHNCLYFYWMSPCDKTQLLLVSDPQRG